MKNIFLFVSLAIITVSISSCTGPNGPDGKDGSAYVAVVSDDGTLQGGGTFDSFSGAFYYNKYYLNRPGQSFYFDFTCAYYDNYSYYHSIEWYGTYSITVNKGTAGGAGKPFWQTGDAGKDGLDKYYKLDCTYSSGMTIYYENQYWKLGQPADPDTLVVGKVYTRDYSDNKYNIHVECQVKNKTVTKAK